ncbi:MAG TPA: SAM-dependent methyltransferase [Acidimicrobiia bacterium]|nr:SAM-dependent methyltransferase [Acidimicrobiia bacterium]
MPRHPHARFVALVQLLARHRPDVEPVAILEQRVLVDGRIVDNPRALVRADASMRVVPARRLRGDVKLSHALDSFAIVVRGRVALDVGASAGGFTRALLARGARRVYAVDVGTGQLVGALRVDPRVVNLEGVNLAEIDRRLVPATVDLVVMDLSYLAVASAVPQLGAIDVGDAADLVALVKPTFELRSAHLVEHTIDIERAVGLANRALTACGWTPTASCAAPRTGAARAREVFVHARRTSR